MIQPNELKIFNLVQNVPDDRGISNFLRIHYFLYEDDKEYVSAEILYKDIQLPAIKLTLDEIEGIPITKELLVEKCGFRKPYEHDWVEYPFSFNNAMGIGFNDDGYICVYYEFDADYALPSCGESLVVPLKHIKYLHQVQNLIYSMSGNEMPIKM